MQLTESELKKGQLVDVEWVYNGRPYRMNLYVQHVFADGRVHLSRKRDGRGCQVVVVGAFFTRVEEEAA